MTDQDQAANGSGYGDNMTAEIIALKAELATSHERAEMHSVMRQETHASALKQVAELVDRVNVAERKLAEAEKRGMEKALDLLLNYRVATKHVGVIADACIALQAEIERVKA